MKKQHFDANTFFGLAMALILFVILLTLRNLPMILDFLRNLPR